MTKHLMVGIVCSAFFCEDIALAALFQWSVEAGGNGHYYVATETVGPWDDAHATATALGGYLVSVLSQEENHFLQETFFNQSGPDARTAYWIGFHDAFREGNFVWTSGEPESYTNWATGEPNNARGGIAPPDGEDFTAINWGHSQHVSWHLPGTWNDTPVNGTTPGGTAEVPLRAIIEFNERPVPEPSSVVLLTSLMLVGYASGSQNFPLRSLVSVPLAGRWRCSSPRSVCRDYS